MTFTYREGSYLEKKLVEDKLRFVSKIPLTDKIFERIYRDKEGNRYHFQDIRDDGDSLLYLYKEEIQKRHQLGISRNRSRIF